MSNTSLIEVLPNLGVVDIAQADRSAHGERCRVGEAPTTAVKLSNLDIQERNQHQNRESKNKFIRRKKSSPSVTSRGSATCHLDELRVRWLRLQDKSTDTKFRHLCKNEERKVKIRERENEREKA